MPRFSLKTMLVAVAVVALWLATLKDFSAANEVRKAILSTILVAAGVGAICYNGRRRVFWGSFFVVMLLLGGFNWPSNQPLIPDVENAARPWAVSLYESFGIKSITFNAVFHSMRSLLLLVLSAVAGFVAAAIYDRSRKTDDK